MKSAELSSAQSVVPRLYTTSAPPDDVRPFARASSEMFIANALLQAGSDSNAICCRRWYRQRKASQKRKARVAICYCWSFPACALSPHHFFIAAFTGSLTFGIAAICTLTRWPPTFSTLLI